MGDRARRSRNSSSTREQVVGRLLECVARRAGAGNFAGDAECHELAHAVLDVEPHAPERLHERLDLEGLLRARAQETQQAGAQRRLHERLESRLDLRRIDPSAGHRHVVRIAHDGRRSSPPVPRGGPPMR